MLAEKRTAAAAQGIGCDGGTHSSQIQIASGQDLQPGEMTSALSRAEVILRPDAQSVRCPIAINIDPRQSINRTPDGVAGASHA
jgi:hypothetical protein